MTLFSVGSFLCALPAVFPHSWQIWELIFGRLVQGGGAIISVAFATVADYVEPEQRSTAMAMLGIPIGLSFIVGIVVGPILAGLFGTASLFWITGILGLLTDVPLVRYLKNERPPQDAPIPLGMVFSHPKLILYGIGGFLMNFFMSTFYFHFPLIVTVQHHLKMTSYYKILLPMMLISGITMFGFSRGTDKGWGHRLAALAFLMFIPAFFLELTPAAVGQDPTRLGPLIFGGMLFYIGSTGLEPIFPALASEAAPGKSYGTALGFYNTLQYTGSAVGAPLAGFLARYPLERTVTTTLIASLIGFLLMVASKPPVRAEAAESTPN
jgi:MFS family permease